MSITGKRLLELREGKELSQEEVAKRIGVDRTTYAKYESGASRPVRKIAELSQLFGVSTDYILGTSDAPNDSFGVHMKRVPMLGYAAAGRPLEDVNQSVAYYDVDDKYDVDFCITVRGDSMIDAGINDGDIVFIRAMSEVPNGKIACIRIDGDRACLKRFYRTGDTVTLVSANSAYAPMVFTKENCESLEVVGLAVIKQSEIK